MQPSQIHPYIEAYSQFVTKVTAAVTPQEGRVNITPEGIQL